ncbi:MAG: hypothetical protein HY872_02300 [Chloroflexi bacterium]|nr:hypothetical protein [Chloroflexota bacterium]
MKIISAGDRLPLCILPYGCDLSEPGAEPMIDAGEYPVEALSAVILLAR